MKTPPWPKLTWTGRPTTTSTDATHFQKYSFSVRWIRYQVCGSAEVCSYPFKSTQKDVNTILVHFLHCTAPLVVVGSLKGIQLGVRNEQSLKTHGDLLGLFTAGLLGCWCVLRMSGCHTMRCKVLFLAYCLQPMCPSLNCALFFPTPYSFWLLIPPHKYHYWKKSISSCASINLP